LYCENYCEMSKVSLNFRKDEVKKNGEVPIFATFSHNAKQHHLRLGETFPLNKIEGKELKAGKDIILNEVAKRVRFKISLIEREIEKAKTQNLDVIQHIKTRLAEESGKTFVEVQKEKEIAPGVDFFKMWDAWVEFAKTQKNKLTKKSVAPNTLKTYQSAKTFFEEFAKEHPIDITKIGKTFYTDLSIFSHNKHPLGGNTFSKYVAILKVMMDWSEDILEEKGIPIMTKYRKFPVNKVYDEVDSLTVEEFRLFQNFKTDKVWLETANDLFLMMCYTCMSVSDLLRFKEHKIYPEKEMIIMDRGKTGNECIIPFYDDDIFRPVALLEKYKHLESVVPYMHDTDINEHLKTIQGLIKFDRFPVSTKHGRKFFATTQYIVLKKPMQIVMRAGGWKTEKAFLRYVGIDKAEIIKGFKDK
jgi:hypothetical protein